MTRACGIWIASAADDPGGLRRADRAPSGGESARDWLRGTRQEQGRLAASVVTVTEIRGGMRSGERREVGELLATLNLFDVDHRIAVRAADYMRRYRRSHSGIGLGDYLIAATAAVHDLQLATLNVRHFPMWADLTAPFHVSSA